MKNNLKLALVVGMLLALPVGAGISLAQSASGSASVIATPGVAVKAGVTTGVPAGYTVIPANDDNRADDQIVQLENLTIQSIASSGQNATIIYASRDLGGPCREFTSLDSASAKIYPCPLAPTVLYQVWVQNDTILLLKNRARASIADFVVGDRINAFGFMDPGTSSLQALIVRDLDRPAVSQYVQLNDLTVVSGPEGSAFRAARKGVEPCLSFNSITSAKGVAFPCPLGVDIATSAEALTSGATADFYRPFRQYYNIQVTAKTRLLDMNRKGINLASVGVGDHVNIYGLYVPGTRAVEALVIRDLSVPRSTGQATLTVTLTDNRIVCITTPCGRIDGMRVDLSSLKEGDQKTTFVASQTSVKGQVTFSGLQAGTYYVTASGAGYAEVSGTAILTAADAQTLSLITSKEGDEKPDIRVISPNGGEGLMRGKTATIQWQSDSRISKAADIFVSKYGPLEPQPLMDCYNCGAPLPSIWTIARGVGQATQDGVATYVWNVPNTLEKVLLENGRYYLKVCYSGTANCDWSDGAFQIGSEANQAIPVITSVTPGEGIIGTTVVLRGHDFAASGNSIYLDGVQIVESVSSSDGTTLKFAAPQYYPYACPAGAYCATVMRNVEAGTHIIYVKNANGTSNSVNFVIASLTY